MRYFKWLLLILLVSLAHAQQGNTVMIRFAGAPSGSCSPIAVAVNNATGDFYDCLSAAWHQVGGAGSGTVTSVTGTANQIDVATGTTTPVLTLSSTIIVPGTITSAAYATSGSNGGISGIEGTGAGLTPAAGTDLLYPDSVNHCWHSSQNNVDVGCLLSTSSTIPIAKGGTGSALGALSLVWFVTVAAITNNVTQFLPMGNASLAAAANEANAESPVPTGGTFSNCRVIYQSAALTGAMSEVITFRKNAAACGSPGTITLTLNSGSTLATASNFPTASDTTNTCTVAAGDYVDLSSVPANTPTAARFLAACTFQPN